MKKDCIYELSELKKFIEEKSILAETDWRHDDRFSVHILSSNTMSHIINMIDDLMVEIKNIEEKDDE